MRTRMIVSSLMTTRSSRRPETSPPALPPTAACDWGFQSPDWPVGRIHIPPLAARSSVCEAIGHSRHKSRAGPRPIRRRRRHGHRRAAPPTAQAHPRTEVGRRDDRRQKGGKSFRHRSSHRERAASTHARERGVGL